jgi:hypothetical protein
MLDGLAFGDIVNAKTNPGFYSLCFPELFKNGLGEFLTTPERPPQDQPSLKVWVKELMENQHGCRFAAHPHFQYLIYHQLTEPLVSAVAGAFMQRKFAGMTRGELSNKLAVNDHTVIEGMRPWIASIPGTAGDHHKQRLAFQIYYLLRIFIRYPPQTCIVFYSKVA